ncbi:DUF4129 domain-containing protein [Mastigocladopsis repens]|uniref:DUF4129 domain-containing protein n=1 Tax=Mastigocladopsis repens TaxID=221287 RepID=UPI00031116E2|nr:DUF4129 domain-containing protein [Mastigocladopsis repens]
MSAEAFEKTSWGWQMSQFQQQVGEWFEYQLSRLGWALPEFLPQSSIQPWLLKLLNLIFWLILGSFLVWVGWRLWRKLRPSFYSWLGAAKKSTDSQGKSTETELHSSQWLRRSQEFSRQGNYRQACRCLYLAMLQHVHDKRILPHKPSRTDGEYLQLLQMSATAMQPYETLITTHEQLCFGNAEIVSENYEHCQQAYREISNT